jgi:hypothetical protein
MVTLTFQTRNRVPELTRAFKSLEANTPCWESSVPIATLVADDASDYEALDLKRELISHYPNSRMLENPIRQTGGRLWNQSVLTTDTKYVILSNDDVQFGKGFLNRVEKDINEGSQVVYYADSACVMLDRAIIPIVGWPGEERYPGWFYMDNDFSLRVRLAARDKKIKVAFHGYKYVRHHNLDHRGTGATNVMDKAMDCWNKFQELWKEGSAGEKGPYGRRWESKIDEINWYPGVTFV